MHIHVHDFIWPWKIYCILREDLFFERNWVNHEIHIGVSFKVFYKPDIHPPN
jgi:hypothetical protein